MKTFPTRNLVIVGSFVLAGVFAATWGLVQLKRSDGNATDTLDADIEELKKATSKQPELGVGKTAPIEKTKPIIERTIRLEK